MISRQKGYLLTMGWNTLWDQELSKKSNRKETGKNIFLLILQLLKIILKTNIFTVNRLAILLKESEAECFNLEQRLEQQEQKFMTVSDRARRVILNQSKEVSSFCLFI